MEAWAEYTNVFPNNKAKILQQPTWLNSHLYAEGKPLDNNRAIQNGLTRVSDIINENETFKSFMEINEKFPNTINFVEYYAILDSLVFVTP